MPIRGSRPPNCCCRSGSRSSCRSRIRQSKRRITCPRSAEPLRRLSGVYTTPHTLSPRGHLLSNGSYTVMVTNAGGGYSRRQNLAMTRWREDITTDGWGSFIFVRDLDTGDIWSTTHQPTRPRGRRIRGDVLARPRRVAARGRRPRDPHRGRRLAGRRCRVAARVDHQSQPPRAQPRPHQLRRSRARAARRRPGAPGVQQPVRRNDGRA